MSVVEIMVMNDFYTKKMPPKNPFLRPWMYNNSAASVSPMTKIRGIIVGGVITGAETAFSYPMDLIKTKLQLDSSRQYKGFTDAIRKTVCEHGISGLYRGLGIGCLFSIPRITVRFSSFELYKTSFNEIGILSPLQRFICGLGAGVTEATLVLIPMETLKVKFIHDQQLQILKYKGMVNGVTKVIQMEGVKGLYQGTVATVLKQGSGQGIKFFVMETLKFHYRNGDPNVPIPTSVITCFGAAAATTCVLLNTPIDVVKTRMQGLESNRYLNTWDCAVKLWRSDGFFVFYRGMLARLLGVGLDVSYSFLLYDTIANFLKTPWP